jgi:hypothetical protein
VDSRQRDNDGAGGGGRGAFQRMQRQQTETGKGRSVSACQLWSCGTHREGKGSPGSQGCPGRALHHLLYLLKGGELWSQKANRLPLELPSRSGEANRGRPCAHHSILSIIAGPAIGAAVMPCKMRLGVEPSTAGIRQGRCDSDSEPCRPCRPPASIHGQPGLPAWSGWSLGTVTRLPFWHFAPFPSLRTSKVSGPT